MSHAVIEENRGYRLAVFQIGIVSLALVASFVFLHWLAVQPTLVVPGRRELSFVVTAMLRPEPAWPGSAWLIRLSLGLVAMTGLMAAALAIMIALRIPDHIVARRLAVSLVSGAIAAAYFFFLSTHAEYRTAIGWLPDNLLRFALDACAYFAGFLSALFLVRFFIGYPRMATAEERLAHSQRRLDDARAKIGTGWRKRLYPAWMRSMANSSSDKNGWSNFTPYLDRPSVRARMLSWAQSSTVVVFLLFPSLLCAGLDWATAAFGADDGVHRFTLKQMLPSFVGFGVILFALTSVTENLKFQSDSALPVDRAKIDWIKATLISGGVAVMAVVVGAQPLGLLVLSRLESKGVFIPADVFLLWPMVIGIQLVVFAFVVALALSIFYRGAVDPRLAARKVTLFGVLGLIVAFLFVLIERTVALKIVQMFGLEPGTGALIAGAAVAASIAPVKNHAEKLVNATVSRYLPLESVAVGERKVATVAMSDLSGYTALSSRDEPQAMLLAALLQRQANKLAGEHRGRVVKSMGDAVMFAFEVPGLAVAALRKLHANFGPAAEQLGLVPLAVHSGAYMGEVTETADGDLYGQTVNLAARLQGVASPGQCVLSEALARAASIPPGEQAALGARRLKNVPEPINCVALA